jgi:hypothetical protein
MSTSMAIDSQFAKQPEVCTADMTEIFSIVTYC